MTELTKEEKAREILRKNSIPDNIELTEGLIDHILFLDVAEFVSSIKLNEAGQIVGELK